MGGELESLMMDYSSTAQGMTGHDHRTFANAHCFPLSASLEVAASQPDLPQTEVRLPRKGGIVDVVL